MAARKLQNEVDRCFKKVEEGVQTFDNIHEKLQGASNPSQKEKLEDALKKEIKKLQRIRDQIKTWTASNEIKDKKPLIEKRKLIESRMEMFKAVEKEMKTKAYSKEGLSAASKLDPKEKEKLETCQFLSNMVEELERQIETAEAEIEMLQANVKRGKKDSSKTDRIVELEKTTERHKWHQGKLELLLRSLENGGVETDQVKALEESIRYYVECNQEVDFMEDDSIYEDLNLQEEEDLYGMNNDVDRVSSQDNQSIQDDVADGEGKLGGPGPTAKGSTASQSSAAAARRPSTQMKSPLPALASLNAPLPSVPNGLAARDMKPAPIPTRAPGEPLKYASAAAAAAASDKSGVGIAPLPPPPGAQQHPGLAPLPVAPGTRQTTSTSPATSSSQPVSSVQQPAPRNAPLAASTLDCPSTHAITKSPALSHSSAAAVSTEPSSVPPTPALEKVEKAVANESESAQAQDPDSRRETNQAVSNGDNAVQSEQAEPVYHLPSSLQDLLETFEATRNVSLSSSAKNTNDGQLAASHQTCPESVDTERPRHYKPSNPYPYTPAHYPQEPLAIFDDSRLYSRVDTDTLFYVFYYRQGTYQQYLAAKALKMQSWRFHKQYQTWFQRHEEPKSITEDYEQGTYRFFDYESTWMNRRKADFRFAYRFLEDDL